MATICIYRLHLVIYYSQTGGPKGGWSWRANAKGITIIFSLNTKGARANSIPRLGGGGGGGAMTALTPDLALWDLGGGGGGSGSGSGFGGRLETGQRRRQRRR